MAVLMPNAHSVCALVVSRDNHHHGPWWHTGKSSRAGNRGIATHIFFTKGEVVLHSLLGFLVDRLALRLLCQSEKEVDKYQCLDKDVPLKSEIAQLEMISHSASTNLSLIAYLKLE